MRLDLREKQGSSKVYAPHSFRRKERERHRRVVQSIEIHGVKLRGIRLQLGEINGVKPRAIQIRTLPIL